jgi:catechol 2,3-dioxygenase-like lactoylglutathione lyase family enzyme
MISAIDHINIVVRDLTVSLKFYTEVLGFKETRRASLKGDWIGKIVGLKDVEGEVAYVVAPAGEPRIELLHYSQPSGEALELNAQANTIGLRHIALRTDDIEAAIIRLREAGIKVFSDAVTVPAGVVKHDAGDKKLCYFLDPDGVILELAQYTS